VIEFRAERTIWTNSLELYARETIEGRDRALVAIGIEFREVKEGGLWPKFLSIPMQWDAGQSLFDALWAAGFRPNGGEATTAHVGAIKAHLEDMRTLVFKRTTGE
jgi:hypothetical protein